MKRCWQARDCSLQTHAWVRGAAVRKHQHSGEKAVSGSRARGSPLNTEGSQQWWDGHWQRALPRGRYLYPKAVPTTQRELFEREKASHIERLLDEKQISNGLVLECGCGTAAMSLYMANRGFRAIATDVSTTALAIAALNAHENGTADGVRNLMLMGADVFSLPFRDGTFDVVMSHGLLEHFDRQSLRLIMSEMVRVTRPGGLFLADIIPGVFSVRSIADWINLPVKLLYYSWHRELDNVRLVWTSHFHGFYENSLDAEEWQQELELASLSDVEVRVMRPFPHLELIPSIERMYVALMTRLLGVWRRFDRAQSRLTRRWGWLYLAHGTKR